MNTPLYRKLQERLNEYSFGFPSTSSGVELRILERLFSEEDAEMHLNLSQNLESADEVARRLGRDVEEVKAKLEDMTERGLLFRLKKGDTAKYGAGSFVAGIWEWQLPTLDRDLAEMVEAYFEEGFDSAIAEGAVSFLRPVPVNRSVEVAYNVAPHEDARELIKNAKKIALAECICRKQRDIVDQGCDKPREVCMLFGANGQYYLDRGMAREVGADEALEVLAKCQEAGLVTQPASARNPGGICNCCGDCCAVLKALNKQPKPAEKVLSNYFAVVDPELCSSCETCLDRCQMGAIRLNDEELAEINLDRCIGCGLCVTTCPTEALRLEPKPADQRVEPPAGAREQAILMAERRGLSSPL